MQPQGIVTSEPQTESSYTIHFVGFRSMNERRYLIIGQLKHDNLSNDTIYLYDFIFEGLKFI